MPNSEQILGAILLCQKGEIEAAASLLLDPAHAESVASVAMDSLVVAPRELAAWKASPAEVERRRLEVVERELAAAEAAKRAPQEAAALALYEKGQAERRKKVMEARIAAAREEVDRLVRLAAE